MDQSPDLEGWTQIAEVLRCDERTAQRYNSRKNDPLVVYKGLGRIVAIKAEVLEWQRRQFRAFGPGVRAHTRRTG